MSNKEPLMISRTQGVTASSLDRNLSTWNVSTLLKGGERGIFSTDLNLFSGTESLVIDGELRRFAVRTIINSLHT